MSTQRRALHKVGMTKLFLSSLAEERLTGMVTGDLSCFVVMLLESSRNNKKYKE